MPNSLFFKRQGPFTISQLAEVSGCEVIGDASAVINDVATLSNAVAGEITFLSNPKYAVLLPNTKASACIMEKRHVINAPVGMTSLVSDNPYASYAKIATTFYPSQGSSGGISDKAFVSKSAKTGENCQIEPFAYIAENATIGANCYIGTGVYVGPGVQIGDGTHIAANSSILCATIGKKCIIHSGVRIGQDGFGFAPSKQGMLKVPQLGGVVIGDDVEIGANTCIDRGALEDTIIGSSTKMDNLVQIGHGAVIGKFCVIVGQVGIAGSTVIGNGVMVGGQAGIAGHLKIGDGAMVAAQSGVMRDVPDGVVVAGTPSVERRQWHRQNALLAKMATKASSNANHADSSASDNSESAI